MTKVIDWPNLAKFELANQKVRVGEVETVFLGDSIFEGMSHRFKTEKIVFRAIGGQVTGQILLRFWQDVVVHKPKNVVILCGINDLAQNQGFVTVEQVSNNLSMMVSIALENGIDVFLCSVLPVNDIFWNPTVVLDNEIVELNQKLQQICEEKRVRWVDLHDLFLDEKGGIKAELTTDGVHLTSVGYDLMLRVLNDFLPCKQG